MVTREEIRGHWTEVKGRLKEHWGQLTEDDLRQASGSTDQLVGIIQQKTGATRQEVENFLARILEDGDRLGEQIGETARQYASAAGEFAHDASDYVRDNMRRASNRAADLGADYSAQLSHTVRSRPVESLAIAFGLGVAAGALFFLKGRR